MMSSTRYAKDGNPLRQERYASDPAFNEGLKASAVAKRCRLFADPAHKELCLHLQFLSMQPGGLAAFVSDFLTRYGDRIGSKTMRENRARKIFDAKLVRAVREELLDWREKFRDWDIFPLKGEIETIDMLGLEIEKAARLDAEEGTETFYEDRERTRQSDIAAGFPKEYAATELIEYCLSKAKNNLKDWLIDFCLNPETELNNSPHWFCDLEQSLFDYFDDRRTDALAGKVVTSIGEQINDALDYAWDEKCMIHINGVARMGKTFQVEQWCRCHPGRVRYVQVPSSNDDISFFREIARSLGTASGSAMKSTQIKRQIEDAIQDSKLMIVFDEAHYAFPQQKNARGYPRRINWILTELVNNGIPVAIVTTPQFDDYKLNVVQNTGWASEQLDGRIAYRLDLPATLPESDLSAVARYNLPHAGKQIISGLCDYAMASGKYLAGIEAVVKRSRFLAKKAGRTDLSKEDIKTAMFEVDPSLSRLSKTEEKTTDSKHAAKAMKRSCRVPARPLQSPEKELVTAT